MSANEKADWWFPVVVCVWILTLIIGVFRHLAPTTAAMVSFAGCVDGVPPCEIPRYESCSYYMALMQSGDADALAPALVPAAFGVRIIVDGDFSPLIGSSYPVPGGRLVWNVWTFRWYDWDYLGAVGRIGDSLQCRWFEPL